MNKSCSKCGREIKDDLLFCQYCGNKFDQEIEQNNINTQSSTQSQSLKGSSERRKLASSQKNDIMISIIGVIVFFVLTFGLQYIKLVGGFLKYSSHTRTIDFFWDVLRLVSTDGTSGTLSYDLMGPLFVINESQLGGILPIFGIIWMFSIIFSSMMILNTAYNLYSGQIVKVENNLPKYGFLLGLISSIIEYGLFILLLFTEDWGTNPPQINILYFLCYFIGLIALSISYSKLLIYK